MRSYSTTELAIGPLPGSLITRDQLAELGAVRLERGLNGRRDRRRELGLRRGRIIERELPGGNSLAR